MQFEIDYADAGRKAPVDSFRYKGIELSSRWAFLHEFEVMKRAVDAMDELLARRLNRIWCDSKCTVNYVVGVKTGKFVPSLKREINYAFLDAGGGHNGIRIEEGDGMFAGASLADLEPNWGEWDYLETSDLSEEASKIKDIYF